MELIARELIEALTAIGIYLEAIRLLVDLGGPSQLDKAKSVIEKAQAQTTRASNAMQRLRNVARQDGSASSAEFDF